MNVYLTSPEVSVYRQALDEATTVIDGFQSPHGLELLATIDWLNRRSGTALDVSSMTAAIASWPGPEGSAERKARIFTRYHMEVAVDHLRAVRSAIAAGHR